MRCKNKFNRHHWDVKGKCQRCGKTCDLKGGSMFRVFIPRKVKYGV